MRAPTTRRKHAYAANAAQPHDHQHVAEERRLVAAVRRPRAARRRRRRARARPTARRSSAVRKTSAASAVFVTGESPIRNEMCATDVYCAAIENTTVMTEAEHHAGARSPRASACASSRGGSSATRRRARTGRSAAPRPRARPRRVMPSNTLGLGGEQHLARGPEQPPAQARQEDENDVLDGARHANVTRRRREGCAALGSASGQGRRCARRRTAP